MQRRPIYLDCNATTPVDPQVVEAMLPFLTDYFGNPGSLNHAYGWEAEAAVKLAAEQVAAAIQAEPTEIIFTSGATESNNLAIKGVAEAYMVEGKHIVTLSTEHSAVLEPCRYLQQVGFSVTYLSVDTNGLVDLAELEAALRPDTILLSVMAANNEIGVLQPIEQIGQLCRDRNILFHTDAAQALGKISLNVQTMPIDLLSLTAHKLHGPKGIGALYVRRRNPRVQLAPQLHGGTQQRGLRAGTLAPAQIVGLGEAVRLAMAEQDSEMQRLGGLRDRLWQYLQQHLNPPSSPPLTLHLNGHPTQRLPNNLSVSFEGISGNALLSALQPDLAISSGSACSTGQASHVLKALGHSDGLAQATLRFGLGRYTTQEDIDLAGAIVVEQVKALSRR
jgi:cysteine desulfurase